MLIIWVTNRNVASIQVQLVRNGFWEVDFNLESKLKHYTEKSEWHERNMKKQQQLFVWSKRTVQYAPEREHLSLIATQGLAMRSQELK